MDPNDKLLGILGLFVRPLIICVTILLILFKVSSTVKEITGGNTITVVTNVTVITNIKYVVVDKDAFNKPPFVLNIEGLKSITQR